MSAIGKTVSLAVFKNMEPGTMNGWESIGNCDMYQYKGSTYVRISEPIEVTFQPTSNDEVIQAALAALDAAELKAREELQRTLDNISNQRAQLLALTHTSEPT